MQDSSPDPDQEAKARHQAQLEQVYKYCTHAMMLTLIITETHILQPVIAEKAQREKSVF